MNKKPAAFCTISIHRRKGYFFKTTFLKRVVALDHKEAPENILVIILVVPEKFFVGSTALLTSFRKSRLTLQYVFPLINPKTILLIR